MLSCPTASGSPCGAAPSSSDSRYVPPVPRLGQTTAALRRNAALGAIAETLRLVGELLSAVRDQPLGTLRSGGVGVREMKRLG